MRRVRVSSSLGDYQVIIGRGLLERLGELLDSRVCSGDELVKGCEPTIRSTSQVEPDVVAAPHALVTNTTVGPLYARKLATALGIGSPLELPDGEAFKRWPQIERTLAWMLDLGLHRSSTIAAVGGGVVTDLVGFAASIFMRGMQWIAVPTTLLAMVDASVGGKTGMNLEQGKNLAGTFWPPSLVVADVGTLETLPDRELRAGLAEVIKSGWIADRCLLDTVEEVAGRSIDAVPDTWSRIVARSISIKAEVVAADERERGQRQCLNLGHTIGHALESATHYERFLHGEAVAWGMRVEAGIAGPRGLLSSSSMTRLERAVASLGQLPPIADISSEVILEHLARDKKRDDLGVAWALPAEDGVALGERISSQEVLQALAALAGETSGRGR